MCCTPSVIYCTGNEWQKRSSHKFIYERQSEIVCARWSTYMYSQTLLVTVTSPLSAHSLAKAVSLCLFKGHWTLFPTEGFGLCVKRHVYSRGEATFNVNHMAVVWHTGERTWFLCVFLYRVLFMLLKNGAVTSGHLQFHKNVKKQQVYLRFEIVKKNRFPHWLYRGVVCTHEHH